MYFVGTRTNGKTFAVSSRDRIPADAVRKSFKVRPVGAPSVVSFDGPNVFVANVDDRKTALMRAKSLGVVK